MHRIRPVREKDFEAIFALSQQAGLGLTSLPKNKEHMKELVLNGALSFFEKSDNPYYFFVLEDQKTGEILGTCGIYEKSAYNNYFSLENILLPPLFPEVPASITLLKRVEEKQGPSEICGLFLAAKARSWGLGKLLSLSRFHFIAAHQNRFSKTVFAIMRGVIDPQGTSPFWNAVGRHFFPVDFKTLMNFRDVKEDAALNLMPKSPIYLELLPKKAQEVVGEPHFEGRAALDILIKQGFKKTGEIDLYEGGPRVSAEIAKIKTLQQTTTHKILKIEEQLNPLLNPVLISNEKLHFCACMGKFDQNTLSIDRQTAIALEVEAGDKVRLSP